MQLGFQALEAQHYTQEQGSHHYHYSPWGTGRFLDSASYIDGGVVTPGWRDVVR